MDLAIAARGAHSCNNLGMPGNWTTTLATMEALEGRRGHMTHIQFHSYGGGEPTIGRPSIRRCNRWPSTSTRTRT